MKKEETEVGWWKPAMIPGPNRPLESHYGQTLLQHFPKDGERENAGNRGVGGMYRECALGRTCVCTHTLRVHFRLELIKSRKKIGKKGKERKSTNIPSRKATCEEVLRRDHHNCEGLCRNVLNV